MKSYQKILTIISDNEMSTINYSTLEPVDNTSPNNLNEQLQKIQSALEKNQSLTHLDLYFDKTDKANFDISLTIIKTFLSNGRIQTLNIEYGEKLGEQDIQQLQSLIDKSKMSKTSNVSIVDTQKNNLFAHKEVNTSSTKLISDAIITEQKEIKSEISSTPKNPTITPSSTVIYTSSNKLKRSPSNFSLSGNQFYPHEFLGGGAFGDTWLFTAQQPSNTYVVKYIKGTTVGSFLKSAEAEVGMWHEFYPKPEDKAYVVNLPLIVKNDFGINEDNVRIIMPYKGEPLRKWGKKNNEQAIVAAFLSATLKLAEYHKRDLLHNDMKTDNVCIINGEINFIDFGNAYKAADKEPRRTEDNKRKIDEFNALIFSFTLLLSKESLNKLGLSDKDYRHLSTDGNPTSLEKSFTDKIQTYLNFLIAENNDKIRNLEEKIRDISELKLSIEKSSENILSDYCHSLSSLLKDSITLQPSQIEQLQKSIADKMYNFNMQNSISISTQFDQLISTMQKHPTIFFASKDGYPGGFFNAYLTRLLKELPANDFSSKSQSIDQFLKFLAEKNPTWHAPFANLYYEIRREISKTESFKQADEIIKELPELPLSTEKTTETILTDYCRSLSSLAGDSVILQPSQINELKKSIADKMYNFNMQNSISVSTQFDQLISAMQKNTTIFFASKLGYPSVLFSTYLIRLLNELPANEFSSRIPLIHNFMKLLVEKTASWRVSFGNAYYEKQDALNDIQSAEIKQTKLDIKVDTVEEKNKEKEASEDNSNDTNIKGQKL